MALYGLFHTREQYAYCLPSVNTFLTAGRSLTRSLEEVVKFKLKSGVKKRLFFFGFRHFICYIATFPSFIETCSKLTSVAEIPLLGKRFHQTWFQSKYKFLLYSHCQACQACQAIAHRHCGVDLSY